MLYQYFNMNTFYYYVTIKVTEIDIRENEKVAYSIT